jgi:hypothetical protein
MGKILDAYNFGWLTDGSWIGFYERAVAAPNDSKRRYWIGRVRDHVVVAERRQRKQKTQPKGRDKKTGKPHEPIEIPVPKRGEVEDGLVDAAVAEGHLLGGAAERAGVDLLAETAARDGRVVGELADQRDGLVVVRGVTGAVRDEQDVGVDRLDLGGGRVVGENVDGRAAVDQ